MKAMKRRTALVRFWQIAILVFVIGMWELSSNMQWIDPFFYSSPSGVVERLYEWATEGTTEGSLWYNLWVTMEEALIGFFAGSITGVFVGIGLGRNRFLSDIFSVYIKAINSIPRVVLAPIARGLSKAGAAETQLRRLTRRSTLVVPDKAALKDLPALPPDVEPP